VTKDEISEIITHTAFYGGWPTAANASRVAKEVFDARGI
jgi:4-carboxymuconolactone decarboxylase